MSSLFRRALCLCLTALLCLTLFPAALAASDYDRPGQKLVALTFDDGPGAYSDTILDVLAKHNAKATFFMNGYKVRRYADQVRRMVNEGHQIANHTYNHPYLTKLSDAKIRQELNATAEAFTEVTGVTGGDTGFFLRPPYGDYNKRVTAAAGVPVIWCTLDSGDWKYQSAARLVSYTGSNAKDGDIVIMHETHKSTAQGLDALLDALEAKGFEFVTVEDLLWRRGITPVPGQVYYSARNTGVNRCEKALWFDESQLDRHWAFPAIQAVREAGILTGNPAGEFLPNFPLTRGMFVTALGRLAGAASEMEPDPVFSDVPAGHYAAEYVGWARDNGLMSGVSDTRFEPDRTITRQELAAVLARYARYAGAETAQAFPVSYADQDRIAPWAAEDVAFCSALGLLNGSGGKFLPDDGATRAMGAVVLDRLSRLPLAAPPDSAPAPEGQGAESAQTSPVSEETPGEDGSAEDVPSAEAASNPT